MSSDHKMVKYMLKILQPLLQALHEKCPNTEFLDTISISPYSVRMRENTDQKNLCIMTLFTQ